MTPDIDSFSVLLCYYCFYPNCVHVLPYFSKGSGWVLLTIDFLLKILVSTDFCDVEFND